ncbi:Homeodomain-like protein [Pseudomassariella vexata]|uniref:Homeodomain-like protein n=1 Tax=Pseudomassariella vexata TaxID=1141098 RepID=A0A1Y2E489_9PEZI|nr:Homeodomain-like protein [Pseudomassariella vexata]ORY66164.1 Homeodomain-like protein [Pseudomassariella vexata]
MSRETVREHGSVQNWNDIALLLPGRTNKDCRKRWSKVQMDIRKGAWTPEEDARLQQAVQQLGFNYLVQSRNADQCAKRWQHVLGPDFKHSPWTPEEDRRLREAIGRYGKNWKQIGLTDLPDRSTHDIRNRSLVLGRRSRNSLSKRSITTQHPTRSFNESSSMTYGMTYGIDQNKGDEDACDEGPECDYTDSAGLHQAQEPSRIAATQQESTLDPELRFD